MPGVQLCLRDMDSVQVRSSPYGMTRLRVLKSSGTETYAKEF